MSANLFCGAKRPLHTLALGALALGLTAFIAGCGGGISATTPIPGGGTLDNPTDTHINGGNTDSGKPTGNGNHPFAFTPAVTIPAQETWRDASSGGDNNLVKWEKNDIDPLPLITAANGVYQNASLKQWADEIFQKVNAQRGRLGLSAVKRDPHMDEIAQSMARDMALRNYFSHYTPEGMSPWDRYSADLIPPYNHAGEIAAKGQESTDEVVQGWIASAEHEDIIATGELTHAGVGVYFDDSDYSMPIHVVMDFAQFNKGDPAQATWYQRGSAGSK